MSSERFERIHGTKDDLSHLSAKDGVKVGRGGGGASGRMSSSRSFLRLLGVRVKFRESPIWFQVVWGLHACGQQLSRGGVCFL